MQKITLEKSTWKVNLNEPFGEPGGFGEVFHGQDADGNEVAIKRLKISANDTASRELTMAGRLMDSAHTNVVEVFDYGLDLSSDRYFIVMPKMEMSLEQYCEDNGPLDLSNALSIALDVLNGLEEVGDIVHRDLKPPNILTDGDSWKVADFGIARFVANATASKTLKGFMSPYYAAPEQWQHERATGKTDIYSLAGIIYKMLTGSPPFVGDKSEIKLGHQTVAFPDIDAPPRLLSTMKQMGRKSQQSRPSLSIVKSQLEKVLKDLDSGAMKSSSLGKVNAQIDVKRSEAEAKAQTIQRIKQEQREIANAGAEMLQDIIGDIFSSIRDEASNAKMSNNMTITLGNSTLKFENPTERIDSSVDKQSISQTDYVIRTDSLYSISCNIAPEYRQYHGSSFYTWEASIFYAKAPDSDDFRWYEMGFWHMGGHSRDYPFALRANGDLQLGLSRVMSSYQTCFGPRPIDYGDADAFKGRVLGLFAQAAQGSLRAPTSSSIPHPYYGIGQ